MKEVCLNLEIRKLLTEALRLDSELLSLLFTDLDLLFHYVGALDGLVVLGFHVLK